MKKNTFSSGRHIVGLLATLGLLFISTARLQAQDNTQVWCLVADGGRAVAMSDVRFLAAADNDSTFAVVLNDGSTIQDVRCVTFEQRIPTGIQAITRDPLCVANDLSLEGVDPTMPVSVYTVGGQLVRRSTASSISLSSLAKGIYIISVGHTNFKISKP